MYYKLFYHHELSDNTCIIYLSRGISKSVLIAFSQGKSVFIFQAAATRERAISFTALLRDFSVSERQFGAL